MRQRFQFCCGPLRSAPALAVVAGLCLAASLPVYGAERVTLRTGFEFDCARSEALGDRVRLYLLPAAGAVSPVVGTGGASKPAGADANYIEVAASAVLRVEKIPDPVTAGAAAVPAAVASIRAAGGVASANGVAPPLAGVEAARVGVAALTPAATALAPAAMGEMLARAGALHNIDVDLLASVVAAESGGNTRAVSRAGAEGLMQLMPGTASDLGVRDRFAPEENIGGGTAYLDALLTRYHNNMKLAVAAYNAGPAAVDRYRGIPPYAETRAYVARVIREFNRRKRTAQAAQRSLLASAK